MAGPKKGSRTAQGHSRREQILDVALDAFAQQGYRGTSMASIASGAGLTEPGLLHHFPSKQQLLLGVIEHHESRIGARVQAIAADRSLADGLLDLAAQHEADPTFIRFFTTLVVESLHPDHPAHAWFITRYARLREVLTEAIGVEQAAGRMRPELDPGQLANLLIAVLDGIELQYLMDSEAVSITQPLRAFLAAACELT